jgi:hypothetical protein
MPVNWPNLAVDVRLRFAEFGSNRTVVGDVVGLPAELELLLLAPRHGEVLVEPRVDVEEAISAQRCSGCRFWPAMVSIWKPASAAVGLLHRLGAGAPENRIERCAR